MSVYKLAVLESKFGQDIRGNIEIDYSFLPQNQQVVREVLTKDVIDYSKLFKIILFALAIYLLIKVVSK
ncbi:MAG: hypothetical protein RMJ67_06015 [Elusimicrobiota bacterium]|nr:hypothetical protein [Endomicrobiia bacterium]MDW8166048.1 hypothetical protein [Elusimicrobiota bacterium]